MSAHNHTAFTGHQNTIVSRPAVQQRLQWQAYHVLRKFRWRVRAARGKWILGRHACLGADVRSLIGGDVPILNLQKCRADFLLGAFASKAIRPRTHMVDPYMRNRQILPMIAAQEQPYWNFLGKPVAVFMDSFSELTDQLYGPRSSDWLFCANHSDLDHSGDFDERFEARGLLPTEMLYENYQNLFHLFDRKFGPLPAIYLHFPNTLEKREKFIQRSHAITEAISRLCLNRPNLHVFAADPAIIDWPSSAPAEIRDFPYHYNDATYTMLANQIRNVGLDGLFGSARAREGSN